MAQIIRKSGKDCMRVLSGIQPSGKLHIGNYFGAMRQYLKLQSQGNECFYFIANYHAMTSVQKNDMLREYTLELARGYLVGVFLAVKSVSPCQS